MKPTKKRLEASKDSWDSEPTARGKRCTKCGFLTLGRGLVYFEHQMYAVIVCFNCGLMQYSKSKYKPTLKELKKLR